MVMKTNEQRTSGWAAPLLIAALFLLGFGLRFWHLGYWNFQATEIFTWKDSQSPQFGNPRPLSYLLNYYLVRPFIPLDEFGLRLLPAIFGVLAIPAMYLVSRRLVGTRAALFVTLLLTLSPLHILYSQLARYWSLVFLLSAIYPTALYLAIRFRDRRALLIGVITCALGVLAHPVSILPLGGLVIWTLLVYLQPTNVGRIWRQIWTSPTLRWWALAAAVVLVVAAIRLFYLLHAWIYQHDKHPGMGQFLSRPPAAPGLKQLIFLSAYTESLTVPLVITGIAGIYVLWKERDRQLAWLLTCLAAIPLVFIPLLSFRTTVSTYYVLPTAPVFFIGAGVFLDRLFDINWKLVPRWVAPVTVTALIITAGLPTIVSDYRDGRRYDFRTAARWLQKQLAPNDVVYSDQHMVLEHYLDREVEHLRYRTAPLEEHLRAYETGTGGLLWIVAPAPSHAFRTNLRQGGLATWMYENCQLRQTVGTGRIDIRQNYLHIYRCPPMAPPALAADRQASAHTVQTSRSGATTIPRRTARLRPDGR
jgi:hypothetical protein